MLSLYLLPMNGEITNGAIRMAVRLVIAAVFALLLNVNQLPSERATSIPKIPRLLIQIHNEPPRTPVYSYHWMAHVVRANEFPSTSHGHDISASK